jgi:hypothetical protein
MSGNLSCIGFTFAPEVHDEALAGAVVRMANEATERLACQPGDYAIWRSRTGAEVWVHLATKDSDGQREIIGLTPFFEGRSEIPVSVAASIMRPDDNVFEGAWSVWIAPDENGLGSYPAVIDAVDWAARASLALPCSTTMRVTCFARELAAFASESEFVASPLRQAELASQGFIPIGLFAAADADADHPGGAPDAEPLPQPSSTALLTGRVVEHATLINEMMGLPFEWLLVESLEATYDVVADPAVVSGSIEVGGTVQVAGWLVGRILDVQ